MESENIISSLNKSLTSELDNDSFNDFMTRIQTFIDGQKWFKKPMALSPPKCAQFGWKCIKPDLLECVTCGAKLSATGANLGNYEAYKACIGKTLSDLKNSHTKHCPWPLTPSPENFVKLSFMPKEEALSQFLKRVNSSLCFQSSLPQIKENIITDLGLREQHVKSLCKLAKIKTEDAILLGKSIIPLSATGWIISKIDESEKCVLKCNNCLRSIWCGVFKLLNSEQSEMKENESSDTSSKNMSSENGVNSDQAETNSEEPPAKKKRNSLLITKGEPFDPLHEHRPWCMWICDGVDSYSSVVNDTTSNSISNSSSVPGWKIFLKSLLRNVSEFLNSEISDSPSKEQLNNVKSLLEGWPDGV